MPRSANIRLPKDSYSYSAETSQSDRIKKPITSLFMIQDIKFLKDTIPPDYLRSHREGCKKEGADTLPLKYLFYTQTSEIHNFGPRIIKSENIIVIISVLCKCHRSVLAHTDAVTVTFTDYCKYSFGCWLNS